MVLTCDENNFPLIKKRLQDCITVLNAHKWLIDSFMLEFFTERHWEKLPSSWATTFDTLSLNELGEWMSESDCSISTVLPLSLLAFKKINLIHSLDRRSISSPFPVVQYLKHQNYDSRDANINWTDLDKDKNSTTQDAKLRNIFRKHVKPKKQYELSRLSQICATVANATECTTVVDAGAGVGHLSRQLSYIHGLNLVCVESQEEYGAAASKFDSQLENAFSKLGISCHSSPQHITLTLNPSTKNLTEFLNSNSQFDTKFNQFGLVGLHTCGDLGPTLIRNFVHVPEIKFLLGIGCCYMKMDLDKPPSIKGYPMSDCGQKYESSFACYEAFEVACHALESYCERLQDTQVEKLKVHCYRATLETLLIKQDPSMRRAGLRSVKNAHLMTFQDYSQKAVEKMNVQLDPNELNSSHVNMCLDQWKRVVAFYSLRLLMAPLIETAVQLDRLLYIYEKGWHGCLIPLFDCKLSPRNYALLCVKPR